MLARRRFISCAICSLAGFAATQVGGTQAMAQGQAAPAAAPAGISRKVLGRTDMPGDKYVAILMEAEFDGGLKVARHTHPGVESTYLMAGGGVLSVKGQPDRTLAPGDGFQIPARSAARLPGGGRQDEARHHLHRREGQAAGDARAGMRCSKKVRARRRGMRRAPGDNRQSRAQMSRVLSLSHWVR